MQPWLLQQVNLGNNGICCLIFSEINITTGFLAIFSIVKIDPVVIKYYLGTHILKTS